MAWGALWLLSSGLYFLRKRASRRHDVDDEHDHRNLRKSSPLLKQLKRPLYGNCFFNPTEKPKYGYLVSDCVLKQACSFRETLDEAKDACSNNPKCKGVTYVPWEERYELRESTNWRESFDGQLSYVKLCSESEAKAEPSSQQPQRIPKQELKVEDEDEDIGEIEDDAPLPEGDDTTDDDEDIDD